MRMEKPEIIELLRDVLCRLEQVEFAYLFGSYARGDTFPQSDIDIAVYMSLNHITLDDELELHSKLCRELKSDNVDLLILNRANNLILLEEIIRHGKLLCDKNLILRKAFEVKTLHDVMDFRYQRRVFAGK